MQSSFYEDEHGARVAWYGYDDGGERAVKFSGECVALTQNGHTTTMASLTNPVVYASPLVTLTKRGYTKHYFEGERRICSAIGGGFTHVEWDSIDATQDKAVKEICDGLLPLLNDGVEEAMHCVELNDIHLSGRLIYRMLWLEATKPHDDPEPVYYYHNDHLGGTAYLTDQTGQVAQTLAYLPYGEDWVDVTTFQYDTSQIGFYQFNGKEKDPETDYLYYGARYYWPDAWNGWLSPDPLMDEYPSISPYAYCAWNPVNLVDPNGELPILPLIFAIKGGARGVEYISRNPDVRTAAYAVNNPIIAIQVGKAKDGGKNGISSWASNFAINMSRSANLSTEGEGSQRNAIRHALWQAILADKFGSRQAERIGNAHENGSKTDLSQRCFENMMEADRVCDLLNNAIGRSIGERNIGVDNATMAKQVAEEFLSNGLWTASENTDNTVSIQKTKISKAEYIRITNEINKLNNYGLREE